MRRDWKRGLAAALAIVAAACGSDNPGSPTGASQANTTPEPVARYRVTFDATWTSRTHAAPPNPHFSRLIGGTHNPAVRFWQPGGLASGGIEAMAERGSVSPLDAEVQAAIAAGTAEHLLSGGDVPTTPGSASLVFEVSRRFPLVSLVTMVAPSPDWFVGVDSLSLVENGSWVAMKLVPLTPWDAGTDSGPDFQSSDVDTSPRESILAIGSPPLGAGGSAAPLGSFRFERMEGPTGRH